MPVLILSLIVAAAVSLSAQGREQDAKASEGKRPKFTLKAQPAFSVAPARVVLTAELTGGENLEDYYCPTVRWEWADDTTSESTVDCAPYEEGKTEIKRRYVVEHNFKRGGSYKVYVRLKQKSREVAAAFTTVQVQQGARDYQR
jgi:hypothetical protein